MTARHARTEALVSEGLEAGWLSEWTRNVPEWKDGHLIAAPDGHPRYVGAAGMSDIGKALAEGLDVKTGVQIAQIERRDGQWQLQSADGRTFEAQTLLLSAPAPQLAALLGGQYQTGGLAAVTFQPCWAVGVALQNHLQVNWPALRVSGHPALEWVAREDTKRPGPPSLMLHARADWSGQHLEDSPEQVTALLLEAAQEIVGNFEEQGSFAHRWRYATPGQRFGQACGWLPDQRLGWCGDWCRSDEHGPRLEAALLSGWALAERV